MPWDRWVHTTVNRGYPACGLYMTWDRAMQDGNSMATYYKCEVRVGKLDEPFMGYRWYALQVSV